MSGFPAGAFSLLGVVDTILVLSITYLYLHEGEDEHVMTEAEMIKKAWKVIAFAVLLIGGTIAVLWVWAGAAG